MIGSGSSPQYNGDAFARDDVVLVSVNYRLHAFGFLYLDELFDGAVGTGNLGIFDQIAALEWVRDNIASFGGNPDNVTIFGQSAGAMSVATLMATPAANGLFRRAIAQSGAAHHNLSREGARRITLRMLDLFGVMPGDWDGLRDVAADRVVEAATKVRTEARRLLGGEGSSGMAFMPVVDGTTRTALPWELIRAGSAKDIDLLVGTCVDEMRLFVFGDPSAGQAQLTDNMVERSVAALAPGAERVLAVYATGRSDDSPAALLADVAGDHAFTIPAVRLAEVQAEHHGNVYMYRFSWPTPVMGGVLGACHVLDIPFVFETLDRCPELVGRQPPTELAAVVHAAWIRFARSGNPNGEDLPDWPPYEWSHRRMMQFDASLTVVEDPGGARRRAWNGLL